MKQNLLQKMAATFILCLIFQDAMAQVADDGKFPSRCPMIDNIVIFNHSLADYVITIQAEYNSLAGISEESNNFNPNQNEAIIVDNEAEVQYSITSKDFLINKITDTEGASDMTPDVENVSEAEQKDIFNNSNSSHFQFATLAELITTYPNPVQQRLTVEMRDNLSLDIRLSNILGQVVYAENVTGMDKVHIDVMDFAKGTYILEIKSDEQRVTEKIQIIR
ncbi:MAG: T9SS type A sorting domain-containing protein [Chitinophagales bacterium]